MEMLKWIALLITHLMVAQSFRYDGSTDCDFVRSSYIQMERSLWDKYVDKVSALTRNERLYKIFNQHHMFIEQYMDKSYDGDDFKVLSKFYEWTNVEGDVKSIHALFKDHFRRRLDLELSSNGEGFDERACLDLAETVVSDPLWPVNNTLAKIENNFINQGLFYKAKSVRHCRQVPLNPHNKAIKLIQLTLNHSRKHQSHSARLRDRRSRFCINSTMQSP
jgi:hypothetical protein